MSFEASALHGALSTLIRDVPDFPEPGVVFKDISPLLADHEAFRTVVDALTVSGQDEQGVANVDKVVGIEARGFILAAPVALALGAGFVPIRKSGKLPGLTYRETYSLEYGEATLEVHQDAFRPGDRVLIVDDVLATGGTVNAASRLVGQCGAVVSAVAVLIELGFLSGRETLADHSLDALTTV